MDTIGIPKGYDEGTHSSSSAETLENQPRDERENTETTPTQENYVSVDVYSYNGEFLGKKHLSAESASNRKITSWVSAFGVKDKNNVIGYTGNTGPDFQHNQYLYVSSEQRYLKSGNPNNETKYSITRQNFIPISIYFAVRLCQQTSWLNDRDQFLYPNDGWQTDREFQLDCIVYTLFHNQNRISLGTQGATLRDNRNQADCVPQTNHWIPFTEQELGLTEGFASHFMQDYLRDFLAGKVVVTESLPSQEQRDLFSAASEAQECDSTNDRNRSPLFTSADEPSALSTNDRNRSPLFTSADEPSALSTNDRNRSPLFTSADDPSALSTNDRNRSTLFPTCSGQHFLMLHRFPNDRNRSPLFTQYSPEAQGVMQAGREVYRYYHQTRKQKGGGHLNASLYDIKYYFKGETNGKMNATSNDDHFNALMENLRLALQSLAKRIEPKVYEYGFLK